MLDPDYALFVAALDAGSLSAAGRALGISPAMMSKRLSRLEKRLGMQLLHRSTRRLAATDEGRQLHAELSQIIGSLKHIENRVRGRTVTPSGTLRISAPTSFGRMHIAPHLARFLQKYPEVSIALNLSDEFADLYSGQLDLAIRISASIDKGLTAHRLAASRRVLCASPEYLQQFGEPTTISALRKHRILAATGQLPWRLSGPNRNIVFTGKSHVETNSSEVVRELALSGAGIALRSLWDVGSELRSGKLRRILGQYEGSNDVGIFAVHPRMPLANAAIDAFIEHLREVYTATPPWEAGMRG